MITQVRIAEIVVQRESGLLITVGLGSCVGVGLYDPVTRTAGLAHILLSDSRQFNGKSSNLLKYADTALPLMMDKILKGGALKKNLVAKIAGGSQLFKYNITGGVSNESVGKKNIMAVKKALLEMGIPILGEDVGGNYGRTMRMHVDSGQVEISSLEGYMKLL